MKNRLVFTCFLLVFGSVVAFGQSDFAAIGTQRTYTQWAPDPNPALKRDIISIGFVRNQVSDFDDRLVHYLTDTEEGSSGSPVFDQSGKLFALHHAGGSPQEVLGRPPLSKNEGIRISKVMEGLLSKGIVVV